MTNIAHTWFFVDRHLSRWERFLSEHHWDLSGVLTCQVALLKSKLGDQLKVEGAYLGVLDTTVIAKAKGKMLGVQTWRQTRANADRGDAIVGHHWGILGLISFSIPGVARCGGLC